MLCLNKIDYTLVFHGIKQKSKAFGIYKYSLHCTECVYVLMVFFFPVLSDPLPGIVAAKICTVG